LGIDIQTDYALRTTVEEESRAFTVGAA